MRQTETTEQASVKLLSAGGKPMGLIVLAAALIIVPASAPRRGAPNTCVTPLERCYERLGGRSDDRHRRRRLRRHDQKHRLTGDTAHKNKVLAESRLLLELIGQVAVDEADVDRQRIDQRQPQSVNVVLRSFSLQWITGEQRTRRRKTSSRPSPRKAHTATNANQLSFSFAHSTFMS